MELTEQFVRSVDPGKIASSPNPFETPDRNKSQARTRVSPTSVIIRSMSSTSSLISISEAAVMIQSLIRGHQVRMTLSLQVSKCKETDLTGHTNGSNYCTANDVAAHCGVSVAKSSTTKRNGDAFQTNSLKHGQHDTDCQDPADLIRAQVDLHFRNRQEEVEIQRLLWQTTGYTVLTPVGSGCLPKRKVPLFTLVRALNDDQVATLIQATYRGYATRKLFV